MYTCSVFILARASRRNVSIALIRFSFFCHAVLATLWRRRIACQKVEHIHLHWRLQVPIFICSFLSLLAFTCVHLYLLVFVCVHTCLLVCTCVYLCLLLFTCVHLLVFTCVHLCLLVLTCVYLCLLVFTCLLVLLVFTCVYSCLLVFPCIYLFTCDCFLSAWRAARVDDTHYVVHETWAPPPPPLYHSRHSMYPSPSLGSHTYNYYSFPAISIKFNESIIPEVTPDSMPLQLTNLISDWIHRLKNRCSWVDITCACVPVRNIPIYSCSHVHSLSSSIISTLASAAQSGHFVNGKVLKADIKKQNNILFNNRPWTQNLAAKRKLCIKRATEGIVSFRRFRSHGHPRDNGLMFDTGLPSTHDACHDIVRVGLYMTEILFVIAFDPAEPGSGTSDVVQKGVKEIVGKLPGQPGDQRHLARRLLEHGKNPPMVWYLVIEDCVRHIIKYDWRSLPSLNVSLRERPPMENT